MPSFTSRSTQTPKRGYKVRVEHTIYKQIDAHASSGRNVTLDFSLTRSGNGTEYPAFLDLRYVVERNLTWAYNFVHTEEEYADLVMPYRTSRRMSRPPSLSVGSMLKAPSLKELERRRDREAGHQMGIYYSSGGRYPLINGDVRYDFEEKDDLGKDQYTFQLEIPM